MPIPETKTIEWIFRCINEKKPYREIVQNFKYINYGDIGRLRKGILPKSNDKRIELGLPELELHPVCTCGEVHTLKRCPQKRKSKPNEKRWRTKPPPCPECGEVIDVKGKCFSCTKNTVEVRTITQYKY